MRMTKGFFATFIFGICFCLTFAFYPKTGISADDTVTHWLQSEPLLDQLLSNDEVVRLPRFCQIRLTVRQANRTARDIPAAARNELAKWDSLWGAGAPHFHHYCWGLGMMVRYKEALTLGEEGQVRQARALRGALGAFNYMIRNIAASERLGPFPLMPELYLNRGVANRGLANNEDAVKDFVNALGAKKDFTDAYHQLSDLLLSLGDIRQARDVLSLGVQFASDPELLQRKLEALR